MLAQKTKSNPNCRDMMQNFPSEISGLKNSTVQYLTLHVYDFHTVPAHSSRQDPPTLNPAPLLAPAAPAPWPWRPSSFLSAAKSATIPSPRRRLARQFPALPDHLPSRRQRARVCRHRTGTRRAPDQHSRGAMRAPDRASLWLLLRMSGQATRRGTWSPSPARVPCATPTPAFPPEQNKTKGECATATCTAACVSALSPGGTDGGTRS